MTEPTDTAPVKSEETAYPILLRSLQLKLKCAKHNSLTAKRNEYYIALVSELESAIRILESLSTHTLVSNELWAEIKRVLGEYANEEHWYFDAGYNQYYPEDHNLRGNEPAQLVLAKLEAKL